MPRSSRPNRIPRHNGRRDGESPSQYLRGDASAAVQSNLRERRLQRILQRDEAIEPAFPEPVRKADSRCGLRARWTADRESQKQTALLQSVEAEYSWHRVSSALARSAWRVQSGSESG